MKRAISAYENTLVPQTNEVGLWLKNQNSLKRLLTIEKLWFLWKNLHIQWTVRMCGYLLPLVIKNIKCYIFILYFYFFFICLRCYINFDIYFILSIQFWYIHLFVSCSYYFSCRVKFFYDVLINFFVLCSYCVVSSIISSKWSCLWQFIWHSRLVLNRLPI